MMNENLTLFKSKYDENLKKTKILFDNADANLKYLLLLMNHQAKYWQHAPSPSADKAYCSYCGNAWKEHDSECVWLKSYNHIKDVYKVDIDFI